MDPELIKALASQGIFASLFGYLGHRQLKQSDKLQDQNDKLTAQLFDLTRSNLELNRLWLEQGKSAAQMNEKIIAVLDRVSMRLDK